MKHRVHALCSDREECFEFEAPRDVVSDIVDRLYAGYLAEVAKQCNEKHPYLLLTEQQKRATEQRAYDDLRVLMGRKDIELSRIDKIEKYDTVETGLMKLDWVPLAHGPVYIDVSVNPHLNDIPS